MKTIKASYNVSKLDLINAKSSKAFKEVPPTEQIVVSGCAIVTEEDEDGKSREFAYIFDNENGATYGGNSAAAVELLQDLIPLMEETAGETYLVSVSCAKSKGGKDYLTFHVSVR